MLYGLGHTMGPLQGEDVCLWTEGTPHQEDQALGEHGPPHRQLAAVHDWEWHHLGARWEVRGGCSVCQRRCLIQIGQGLQTEALCSADHAETSLSDFLQSKDRLQLRTEVLKRVVDAETFPSEAPSGLRALRTVRKNRLLWSFTRMLQQPWPWQAS